MVRSQPTRGFRPSRVAFRALALSSLCAAALATGCGGDTMIDEGADRGAAFDAVGDSTDVPNSEVSNPDVTGLDQSAADVAVTDGAPTDADGSATDAPSPDAMPWMPPPVMGMVTFPYRPYLCTRSIRAPSPSRPTATFHADMSGAAPQVRNLHLTLAGDPSTSVVIQWSTDATTLATEVRFGDNMMRLDRVAQGFSFTYPGVTGRRQHEVHLCGLEPGRTYYYNAGGSGGRSGTYAFVTAPAGPSDVTVLVLGDSRTDVATWRSVAARARMVGADLFVLSGDAVESGSSQSQWDALFEAAPELFASTPGVWAHGNHEGLSEVYFAQFAFPDHGGTRGVEEWFSLRYGPMQLVVLNDTPRASTDIAEQTMFLRTALGSVDRARTPFVLTMHHKPMYTTSIGHSSETTIRGAWAPEYDRAHVNLDLTGHVHSYESTQPLRGGTSSSTGMMTTDAMGTRYIAYGGSGAPLYGFLATQPWIQMRESVHGYAVMDISSTALVWTAYRTDGSRIETFRLAR